MKKPGFTEMKRALQLTRLGRLKEAMDVLQAKLWPASRPAQTNEPAPTVTSARAPLEALPGVEPSGESAPARDDAGSDAPAPRTASWTPLKSTVSKPRMRVGVPTSTHTSPIPAGAGFEDYPLGALAQGRTAKLYVPASYDGSPCPLVVMLHGCTQTPDDFARGTRMNALAEHHNFLVVYPAQSMRANVSRCWNWFNGADQQRGHGEPAWIADVTRKVIGEFAVDPSRVYVAGLSAGGAMAAILGLTYPDIYAAVGVHSGLAAGSAHDVASAMAAMRSGSAGGVAGEGSMPTIVFHGDSDTTVHPDNGVHVAEQARGQRSQRADVSTGTTSAGVKFERSVEPNADGLPMLEYWLVGGAGHAWSGGDADGSFVAPDGPDASEAMWQFFIAHRRQ